MMDIQQLGDAAKAAYIARFESDAWAKLTSEENVSATKAALAAIMEDMRIQIEGGAGRPEKWFETIRYAMRKTNYAYTEAVEREKEYSRLSLTDFLMELVDVLEEKGVSADELPSPTPPHTLGQWYDMQP